MFRKFKRVILKMFRELLVFHNSSLEYRAKIITLVVSSDGNISDCELEKLKIMTNEIYKNDTIRANLLLDTIQEYHIKIITDNGLNFQHLIELVAKETKEIRRFTKKIDIEMLSQFQECLSDEDEIIFQNRILSFLSDLKEEYSI